MTNDADAPGYPRLEFYWIEPDADQKAESRWGELAGATHRLQAVVDELEALTLSEGVAIERALARLSYHIENFLIRTYELRERLVQLVGGIAGADAGGLKKPTKRTATWVKLGPSVRHFQPKVDRLLEILDSDILLRNQHTHDASLRLGLYTGSDIHEPDDVLMELKAKPEIRLAIEGVLHAEILRLAREYSTKAGTTVDATWEILDLADGR